LCSQIRNRLVEEVEVLINVAASIDFNEPIADAMQINYFGLLRMLDLAKDCKKLQAFTHVSTSYVNCDKRGVIEEKIYDIDIDPEEFIANIVKMTP
jgi:nucleoside-diphosphate-sugar epimerase